MPPTVRKVERYELCILRQRVPRCSSAYWSEVGPNMQIRTSAIAPRPAARTAWIRLSAASLDGRSLERCEPTMTIGTGVSCTMNERIAAVWPIVSVPWPTTMPSTPLSISRPMASASATYCSLAMFSEKTPKSFFVVRFATSASSGTAPYSSPGVKAGMTAPVR